MSLDSFHDRRLLSLRETLGAVSFVGTGDIKFSRFVCDSRHVRPGDVFFAFPGFRYDGRQFLDHAMAAGASAVVVDRPMAAIPVPQCVVADPRAAFARICFASHAMPQQQLTIAGVTGTNGKTTSTWLLRAILEAAGIRSGLLGTIEYSDGINRSLATLTTPTSDQMAAMFRRMVERQTTHCVMEVSSHALDQSRCASVPLATAAVTNVTRDHLDYHGNQTHYLQAKARIAELLRPHQPLLIGIDDKGCRQLRSVVRPDTEILTFGLDSAAALSATPLEESPAGTTVQLRLLNSTLAVRMQLVGRHNILNALVASGMAEQLGVPPEAIVAGLEGIQAIPGRMERINAGQDFTVLIDYAHTPDGLQHCVATARSLTRSRVILVFGAGGNRDRTKRPLMAKAAESADSIIVTSDNPRSETPLSIISDICEGFQTMDRINRVTDREKAIEQAIQMARTGDVVVIAGRGHETTQEIGQRRIAFDDRKVTRRLLLESIRNTARANPDRILKVRVS
ncbi:MAG: UDP-N-acetylmuramoyl-L-alanyl-D-glutamate--2,6-diaminopimelate ligase [Planctomycetota bacterium]